MSVEQLEEALRSKPSLGTLASILSSLLNHLNGSDPLVVKRAVAASTVAFRRVKRLDLRSYAVVL